MANKDKNKMNKLTNKKKTRKRAEKHTHIDTQRDLQTADIQNNSKPETKHIIKKIIIPLSSFYCWAWSLP